MPRVTLEHDGHVRSIEVSEENLLAVNYAFNPNGLLEIADQKLAAAALLELCDEVLEKAKSAPHPKDRAGRYASIAKTHVETAQMWVVKAEAALI